MPEDASFNEDRSVPDSRDRESSGTKEVKCEQLNVVIGKVKSGHNAIERFNDVVTGLLKDYFTRKHSD